MKTSSLNPDAFDTRILFRIYSACAVVGGLLLWLGHVNGVTTTIASTAEAKRAFLQMSGAILVAIGCAAAGFGQIEEPRSRHRALGWFAFAHLVALAGVVSVAVINGGIDDGDLAPPILIGLCVVLFYFWQTGDGYRAGESMQFTRLLSGPRSSDDRLRSAYEERIREAASQEERHRLARDLHDSVKQQIYAMQTAGATVEARLGSDDAGAREALERLRECGREAMAEMEAMLDSLRSTALTNAGLVEALKKQAEALRFRTGANVRFEIGALPPDQVLSPGVQQAIFKVAQEALANIGRHARASTVRVVLAGEDDRLVLRVEDDGGGFSPSAPAAGMGLANMRERAAAFDARLDVSSQPGAGTRVVLAVPFRRAASGDVAYYRRQAFSWAAATLGIAVIVAFAWLRNVRFAGTAALLVANAIILVRSVVVYQRARRRAEESPWIESPSHS
jgi:signal transduction histidine kinase